MKQSKINYICFIAYYSKMNIIVLLESISLDKSAIGNFSASDFTQIKKQLAEQKELNPEIEDSDIAQLIKALKSFPDEFKVILNNRILLNFFSKKEYPRTYFSNEIPTLESEKVKTFVQAFFGEELKQFFIQNLESNKFTEISQLAEAKDFFTDGFIFTLRQYALDKMDAAISTIKPPFGDFSKILYIRESHFFAFVNHIKDEAIEEKVRELLSQVKNVFRQDYNSELANKTFAAMGSYVASDTDLSKEIKSNKDVFESGFKAYAPKKRNLTWVYVVVALFIGIRIIIFFSMAKFDNSNNDTYNNDGYDEEVVYEDSTASADLDPYYTNMKFAIDSFQVFLTQYKNSEIRHMKRDVALKTGDNPFETFYKEKPAGSSSNFIKIRNNTGYDMVLLENAVVYDSIKMPNSAIFIKAGEVLEVNFDTSDTQAVFNIYLGKKWGTFQTDSKHLFIRNHSIVEYRFSELIPAAQKILKTDYRFVNDAVISYSKGGLDIRSRNAQINPLHEDRN